MPVPAELLKPRDPDLAASSCKRTGAALSAGRDVVVHTTRGPKDLRLSSGAGSGEVRWG